jgi:hypothetical protein
MLDRLVYSHPKNVNNLPGNYVQPVEGDIVLSHKLIIADIFRVPPPLLPLVGVVRGDADVPDGSVEPYVEDLKKARGFFLGNHLKLGIFPETTDIKGMRKIAI